MPKMGESVMEGKILSWLKQPGERIKADESLLEVATDKVDTEIPSPTDGLLTKILVKEGEVVAVGTPIAVVETQENAPTKEKKITSPAATSPPPPSSEAVKDPKKTPPTEITTKTDTPLTRFYSPLVRSIAKKHDISLKNTRKSARKRTRWKTDQRRPTRLPQKRKRKPCPNTHRFRRRNRRNGPHETNYSRTYGQLCANIAPCDLLRRSRCDPYV